MPEVAHDMAKQPCGQHTELASNDAVRVTRCTCGTLHVTLQANGVTVRLTDASARALAKGLESAIERLDAPTSATSSCVN